MVAFVNKVKGRELEWRNAVIVKFEVIFLMNDFGREEWGNGVMKDVCI